MFYSRGKVGLLDILKKAKSPNENGFKKDFPDIQGASMFAWDNQEGRIEGKAFKEVGTEPTKSQKYKKMVLSKL